MDLWEVRRTIAPKNVKQLMAAQLQKSVHVVLGKVQSSQKIVEEMYGV
jgi:hypothetical protein